MADNQRDRTTETPKRENDGDNLDRERSAETDSDVERGQVRSSNDRDQHEGVPKHNRGSVPAAQGQRGPTDPDSAESDVDRDDTVTD